MAFFDVLTGKVYRWNTMKDESFGIVCGNLKTFVSSRLPEYPQHESWFVDARNRILAYYLATSNAISTLLDKEFAQYKAQFYSLNPTQYMRFISAFNAASRAHSQNGVAERLRNLGRSSKTVEKWQFRVWITSGSQRWSAILDFEFDVN